VERHRRSFHTRAHSKAVRRHVDDTRTEYSVVGLVTPIPTLAGPPANVLTAASRSAATGLDGRASLSAPFGAGGRRHGDATEHDAARSDGRAPSGPHRRVVANR
jgi:hypothetical protein